MGLARAIVPLVVCLCAKQVSMIELGGNGPSGSVGTSNCPSLLSGRCTCGVQPFGASGRPTFVTNCTNAAFPATASYYMQHVPPQTEVLLMTGNNFVELPRNLLNQTQRYDKLYLVDLSRNRIESIHGEAFHNMKSVQVLILDHNQLTISPPSPPTSPLFGEHDPSGNYSLHPRLFEPLRNLEELHLRDAFSHRYAKDSVTLMRALHEMFFASNLSSLKVLNLEQNRLSTIGDEHFFCATTELQAISLAQNLLPTYPINASCLRWLSKIDVSRNAIESFDEHAMQLLRSSGATRIGALHLNISSNPFACNCALLPFFRFVKAATSETTDVRSTPKLDKLEHFRCAANSNASIDIKGKYFDDLSALDFACDCSHHSDDRASEANSLAERTQAILRYRRYITLSYIVLLLLLALLTLLLAVMLYTNRQYLLATWTYFLLELNAKNDYTALNPDAQDSVAKHNANQNKTNDPNNTADQSRSQPKQRCNPNSQVAEVEV